MITSTAIAVTFSSPPDLQSFEAMSTLGNVAQAADEEAKAGPGSFRRLTLEPIPADIVAANERSRRDANHRLGACRCGCPEIDDYALLGGLERGSVVGISSEREEFAFTVRLKILPPTPTPTPLSLSERLWVKVENGW